MAIQQAQINQVKTKATNAIARAKARRAQVTAHAQVLKAKRLMNRAQA